jgi:hypothetical protein
MRGPVLTVESILSGGGGDLSILSRRTANRQGRAGGWSESGVGTGMRDKWDRDRCKEWMTRGGSVRVRDRGR